MKIHCSSLRCPHCGSKDFNLIKGDIFLCEYCRGKFNFDLDEVDFSSENKVFLDELRIAFTKKMNEKYMQKKDYHNNLLYYKKLSSPRAFRRIGAILLTLSSAMLVGGIFTLLALILACISTIMLIINKKFEKQKYEKYKNKVSFYALKIVEIEDEINVYSKFISKLTK